MVDCLFLARDRFGSFGCPKDRAASLSRKSSNGCDNQRLYKVQGVSGLLNHAIIGSLDIYPGYTERLTTCSRVIRSDVPFYLCSVIMRVKSL